MAVPGEGAQTGMSVLLMALDVRYVVIGDWGVGRAVVKEI
jgi:hypothetical protein